MSFRLTFETTNAAFADGNHAAEVARILREVARAIDRGHDNATVKDANGNTIGDYHSEDETEPSENEDDEPEEEPDTDRYYPIDEDSPESPGWYFDEDGAHKY